MVNFVIGDRVAVVDEVLSGTVAQIKGDYVTLITAEGFSLRYAAKDLIKLSGAIKVSPFEVARAKKEKEIFRKKSVARIKPRKRNAPQLEVDLHIQQLVKSTKNLTTFEMLRLQLEAAQRYLEFALAKRIQKVVFIHGVGEGVLKSELYYLFKKYDNLKFYDADSKKYGLGATEVAIFQNP